MAKAKPAGVEGKPFENPLVPHRRLREIYAAMLGARLLDQWMAAQDIGAAASTHGEEAVRVSTLIALEKGDLVVDPSPALTTHYLLGAVGASLREARRDPDKTTLEDGRKGRRLRLGSHVPVEDTLDLAIGAALALKAQGQGRMLVAYMPGAAVGAKIWHAALRTAFRTEAPVIFVAMPARTDTKKSSNATPGELSLRSTHLGVPGITVEADDAVALYRVAQESAVRIRAGGGPVLLECVRLDPSGTARRRSQPVDTVEQMRAVLIAKGAADEAWAGRTATRLGTTLLGELEAGQTSSNGPGRRSGKVLQ